MLPVRVKYSVEVRRLTFNFASKLATGDTLVGGATVTVSPGLTVGSPSSDLTAGVVTVLVSGGSVGNSYTVTCQHGTTNGETLVMKVTIEVDDDVN